MPITLSVHRYREGAPAQPLFRRFDRLGGALGRAPGNDLVLDDPTKYISRIHARIEYRDGGYCLVDVGSNPSLVNDRPVGSGRLMPLADGDRISIGDYHLVASVEAEAPAAPALPPSPLQAVATPPAAAPGPSLSPFLNVDDSLADASILNVGGDRFNPAVDPLSLNALGAPLPLSSSAAPAPAYRGAQSDHAPPEQAAFALPRPTAATMPAPASGFGPADVPSPASQPASGPPPAPLMSIPDDYDPLADFLPPRRSDASAPSAGQGGWPQAASARAPVSPGWPAASPDSQAMPPAAALVASYSAPSAAPSSHPSALGEPQAPIAAQPAAASAAHADAPDSPTMMHFAALDPAQPHPLTAPPSPQPVAPPPTGTPAASPAYSPLQAAARAEAMALQAVANPPAAPLPQPLPAQTASPVPPPAAPAAPSPVPHAVPSSAPAATRSATDDPVIQAFLRGLGLTELTTRRTPEEIGELAGAMLREATNGTMEVLLARAMTKRESRLDMTMIASQANNPLKFFPDATSALTQMLNGGMPGYMAPQRAYANAFDDLKAHELAIMAGMRAALAGVLKRFDPQAIEARLQEPSVMDKVLASSRKAKMWDRMVDLYAELAGQADDDFQRLFGEAFGAAYEQQVQRLRQAAR